MKQIIGSVLVGIAGLIFFGFALKLVLAQRREPRASEAQPRLLGPGERLVLWISSIWIGGIGYLFAFGVWLSEAPD